MISLRVFENHADLFDVAKRFVRPLQPNMFIAQKQAKLKLFGGVYCI